MPQASGKNQPTEGIVQDAPSFQNARIVLEQQCKRHSHEWRTEKERGAKERGERNDRTQGDCLSTLSK